MSIMSKIKPYTTWSQKEGKEVWGPFTGTEISCGVHYLYGFSSDTPEAELKNAFRWRSANQPDWLCAFFVFSDYNFWQGFSGQQPGQQLGKALAKYISDQKLGTITASGEAINPNSENTIQVWIWQVDWKAMKAWCKKRRIALTIPK